MRRKKQADLPKEAAEVSVYDRYAAEAGFHKFYLIFIIACALVALLSILLAIYANVLGGIGVAIILAISYRVILSDELKRRLSLSYRRVDGGLALSVKESGREDAYLPSRLMWLDVTELSREEKKPAATAVRLYLPRSLRHVDRDAFSGMDGLRELIYEGSEEEWSRVEVLADLTPYCLRFNGGYVPKEDPQ